MDFLSPLYIRENKNVYIALFTCAVTRALHLEHFSNLTIAEFLMAFRRFTSRRGICKTVYSDNAKTFKKTEKDLQRIWDSIIKKKKIQNYFSENRIQWKFIIARAVWWGDFEERLVRSMKICLKILDRAFLSYEVLETTLKKVEAALNSRPLTFVYNDFDEPSPLCTRHFLIGKKLIALSY